MPDDHQTAHQLASQAAMIRALERQCNETLNAKIGLAVQVDLLTAALSAAQTKVAELVQAAAKPADGDKRGLPEAPAAAVVPRKPKGGNGAKAVAHA